MNQENQISENKNPRTSSNSGDKTFNKLSKLQKLIKKESALKKLCKYQLINFNYIHCSF